MAIFIKFNGVLGLDGQSTDAAHNGWSELWSFSMGDNPTGIGAGGSSQRPSVKEIACTKANDAISAMIFQFAARGDTIPSVLIDNTKFYGDKPKIVLQIELKNVIIIAFSTSGGQGDSTQIDRFTLNFSEIKFRDVSYDD